MSPKNKIKLNFLRKKLDNIVMILLTKLWKNLCEEEKINLWLITRPKFDREVEAMHDFDSILERISSFQ